jgi:uncharacterized SAM-binding protein YcdF (DUF218 family)
MFMFLRLLKPFFLPPTLIAIGMAISLFLFIRGRQRLGKVILAVVLGVYYLLSIGPVSYFLAKGLESKFANVTSEAKMENVEAIVVLSGGARKKGGCRPFNELSGSSWRRFWHGIKLHKEFKGQIPILYSGGSGNPFDPVSVEAELVKGYAESIGVPEEKFWIDSKSRNTYESGFGIKRILDERFTGVKEHRVILVTSAFHMWRAVMVMEKVGIHATPSPADFVTGSFHLSPLSFLPSVGGFSMSYFAIYEWVGIVSYKLLGRI